MKRSLAYLAAVGVAVVPALMGLSGNASFSQAVPVRVPDTAQIMVDDHGDRGDHRVRGGATAEPSGDHPTESATTADDHGGDRSTVTTGPRVADDHGGDRSTVTPAPAKSSGPSGSGRTGSSGSSGSGLSGSGTSGSGTSGSDDHGSTGHG